jgi:ABC-2 type transport system ATP-binding protein
MNGSILGFSRTEIDRIFDDIVAFSEIEEFIDNQVKHYSSGMAARLGFAVAVNVEPEILLVDEVLAVGDEAFQRKCLDRIKQFQREGRTILLVTHAVDMVRQICDRAAVLDHGELVTIGAPGEAALAFREHLRKRGAEVPKDLDDPTLLRNLQIQITDVTIEYPEPGRAHVLPSEPLDIRVDYEAPQRVDDVIFSIAIYDQEGRMLLGTNSELTGDDVDFVEGRGSCRFAFERIPLLDGVYLVSIGIHSYDGELIYDQRAEQDTIEVLSHGREVGLVHFPVHVRLDPNPAPAAH